MTPGYVPFITDPEHLRALEGTTYAVLRPRDEVVDAYDEVRERLRVALAGLHVSFPAYPHVTLRGWPVGTQLKRIREAVAAWSERTPPLAVAIDRIGTFPPPYRVVVVLVRKTDALRDAFSLLVKTSSDAGLPLWPEWTADSDVWEFHMSAAYCSELDDDAWERLTTLATRLPLRRAACDVHEVEIALFAGGAERSGGTFPLEGGR